MEQDLGGFITKALEALHGEILVVSLADQLLRRTHRRQDPWVSILVAVYSLTEIHFAGALVGLESLRNLIYGIGRDGPGGFEEGSPERHDERSERSKSS